MAPYLRHCGRGAVLWAAGAAAGSLAWQQQRASAHVQQGQGQGQQGQQGQAQPWGTSAYNHSTPASIRAAALAEVGAAQQDAAAAAAWRAAAAAHGWQRGGEKKKPLVFVVADSLSIDWGPHFEAALGPVFRYGRKNLNCAKGSCRAWCPRDGEGPKDLVANPELDGCNGGDSRHNLQYLRHLAESTAPLGPGDEQLLSPTTTPSRLTGVKADVIVLNCGLWDVKTDPQTGERAVALREYERNVREMVRVARQSLGERVVWVSTTPLDDHKHNVA